MRLFLLLGLMGGCSLQNRCNADDQAALGEWLGDLSAVHDSLILRNRRLPLPERPEPPRPVEPGGMVAISKDAVTLDGRKIGEASLASELKRRASHAGDPQHANVMVAGDATWSSVAELSAAAAKAHYLSISFLFVARPTLERPAARAEGSSQVFRRCRSVLDWLPTLAWLDPETRAGRIAAELPRVLQKCGCDVDLASVRGWAWEALGPGSVEQPSTSARLLLASQADENAAAVQLPGSSSWSTAVAEVIDAANAGKPVRLVAAP